MQKYTIKTEKDTEKLAKKLAGQFKGGKVIGLIGNLGTGKTTFTQYLAKSLGITKTVNSPTFNIIKAYPLSFRPSGASAEREPESRKKIKQFIHIDTYRLNSPDELEALGVSEYFNNQQTITVIEWADKIKSILPSDAIIIKITLKKNGERMFAIK